MYDEQLDGRIIEIESCDVDFLENDFPNIGDAKRDLDLYEMEDVEDNVPFLSEGGEIEIPYPVIAENDTSLQPSGSVPNSGSTPLDTQDPQVAHRKSRGRVPRRRFNIKEEALMCIVDDDEPASYKEALSSAAKSQWIIAMQE